MPIDRYTLLDDGLEKHPNGEWVLASEAADEIERLRRYEAAELSHRQCHDELRAAILADPDHDNDTINWALELADEYLTYTQDAEAAEKGADDAE